MVVTVVPPWRYMHLSASRGDAAIPCRSSPNQSAFVIHLSRRESSCLRHKVRTCLYHDNTSFITLTHATMIDLHLACLANQYCSFVSRCLYHALYSLCIILGRTATRSIRCGLFLPMFRHGTDTQTDHWTSVCVCALVSPDEPDNQSRCRLGFDLRWPKTWGPGSVTEKDTKISGLPVVDILIEIRKKAAVIRLATVNVL